MSAPRKPGEPASFEFHYQEFLSRGLSEHEAKRLAKAVIDRPAEHPITTEVPPLELSPAEARRLGRA